jgi:hypothetical protein
MRGFPSLTIMFCFSVFRIPDFGHFGAVPVADLAGGHQGDAIMADDTVEVEQRLQIFDAMRGYATNR